MEAESKNHKSISNGVKNCAKLTPKSNLTTGMKVAWAGIVDNGLDLYFYAQDAQTGECHNLFMNPDILSKNEVEAHEDCLR